MAVIPPVNPGIPVTQLAGGGEPRQDHPASAPQKVFGKYTSMEEAEKGFGEMLSTLTERNKENDMLKQRVTALEQSLMAPPDSGVSQDDPLDSLKQAGIDPNLLFNVVGAFVENKLAPVTKGVQAQAEFEVNHPEFTGVRPQVSKYLAEHPMLASRYNSMYNTDPYGAMEWALDRYKEANPAPPRSAADNPSTGAIPNTAPTSERTEINRAELDAERDKAVAYYQNYGDLSGYIDNLVKRGIRPRRI